MDLTNDLLRTANESLIEVGKSRGILLLFDNLDRYDPEQIDRLLFRGHELVRRLDSHAIFTIPIALEYDPLSGAIQDCYGPSLVLPMLSLRPRNHAWEETVTASHYNEDAVNTVRAALSLRLDLNLFQDPADVNRLVRMSGGCIRDLMHLVTLAFSHAGHEDRFTSRAVDRAIRELRAIYTRRLNADDYRSLVAIARREHTMPDEGKAETARKQESRLLFNLFALEYLDQDLQPWVDIHPIILEIEEFCRVSNSHSPSS